METVQNIFLIWKKIAELLKFKEVSCICVDVHTYTDIYMYIFKGKSTPNVQIRKNNGLSLSPLFSISIYWVIVTVDS